MPGWSYTRIAPFYGRPAARTAASGVVFAAGGLGYGEPGYVSRGYDGLGRLGSHRRRRFRPWALLLLLVLLLLLAYFFRAPLLTAAGRALIAEDPPQQGDVIVVLAGSLPDRMVRGAELQKEGLAEKILLVRGDDIACPELVTALALKVPDMAELNREIGLQLGVPPESILILEGRAGSTWEEALAVRDYLEAHSLRTLLLVTSPYQALRAKKTFARVLGDAYLVLSLPSPYAPCNPENWWRERSQRRAVLAEYRKLLGLSLFGRRGLERRE